MKANSKIALIVSTLVLSSSAHANFLKDLLDKFQSVNKEQKSECASMSNDEVANLCVQEVCGDASKYPIIFNAQQAKEKFHSPEMQAKIDEQEKGLRHYQQFVKDEAEKIEQAKNDLLNLTPEKITDKDAKALIQFIFSDLKDKHKITSKIGKDVSKKDTVRITLPPGSPFSGIYKDVISKINVYDHLSIASKLNIVNLDNEKTFEVYRQKAKELQEELNKTGKSIDYDFQDKEKKLLEAGKHWSDRYYVEMVYQAQSAEIELEKPFCNEACKESLVTFLKARAQEMDAKKIAAEAAQKFDYDDAIAECSATMTLTNIKAKDSSEIEKEFPKLIEKFKKNTSLKFSDHSKGLLLNKIDKDLKVIYNNNFYEKLELGIDKWKTNAKSHPITTLDLKYHAISNPDAFRKVAKTPRCQKVEKVATISDAVSYDLKKNEGQLFVSPFSCEHTHIGKEVMAHELGHAVSFMIAATPDMSSETKKNFSKMRECSRKEKRTTKFPGLISPHEGDKWTTEEDTADLFSFALSEDNESFMGCALIAPDGQDYTSLKMRKSFFDTHSSGIQRLMLELQYKNPGKITEACAEVIKRSKAKITNKCF